ncbi:RNA polymerase sigma factor [Actinosynnema sp. CS-041913]|uniref:RNA polymerase sigma factor n=1 Tax=Actinosynnema sp. CS-041913 TaxID=3239917 RepID=UPI003D9146CA
MTAGHDGFDEFFRADFARLIAFLVKLGYRSQDAEDAAGEAMASLYANWASVEQPRAWVRLVARRHVLRFARRDVERSAREVLARRSRVAPDERADVVEDVLWLAGILEQLSPQERVVMVLSMDGFTSVEIAAHIGIAPATARSHLHNARKRLKTHPQLADLAAVAERRSAR